VSITPEQWEECFLDPMLAVANGAEAPDEIGSGLAGFTLDGILAVKEIDGQKANDWECVEMVHRLIEAARLASLRLERADG